MKSNRKLLIVISAGVVFSVAVLNIRLNTQQCVSLSSTIESLTEENLTGEYYPYLEDNEIDLHGSLATIPVKSYSQPFQATKYSSYIRVNYLISLSNISVQVVKASGQIVYSNTVNPVAGGQLYISLTGLSAGDYTLVFTAPNGNSVYGDFEI